MTNLWSAEVCSVQMPSFFQKPGLHVVLFSFWLMLIATPGFPAKLDLRADASFYSWRPSGDGANSVNQLTQDVRIRLRRILKSDLSLRLNLSDRNFLDGSASQMRIREASIDWQNPLPRMAFKIGRCYPLIGSSTGMLDGLDLNLRASSNLLFGGFAGFAPEYHRPYGRTHLDHFRAGTGLLYNNLPKLRLESYAAYELYKNKTYRQILGFSGYISPISRLTSYNYAKIDLHHRKLSSFISHIECELTPILSVFSEYSYRAPLIGPTMDTQVALTDYTHRLPVYREMSFGMDLRVLSAFSLRAEIGRDTTWGRKAKNGAFRLTSFNFLHTGFDVFAGYSLRNRRDSMRKIYSATVSRSIGKGLVIEGNFSHLRYRFAKSPNEYRTQRVGFNAIYRILHDIDISVEIERARHGKDFSDIRIFTNVGYAVGL
ncbi:MAG: hypothetical protein ACE5PV_10970 [Candidatus Poribacteria bacterium]